MSLTFGEDAELLEAGARAFGDYELTEEIGRGGMGVVYRATQQKLKRSVAVKLLLGGAFADAAAKRRFRQEAELAAGLHHPGIVPIYEAGETDGQAFYAMEYVAGSSLAQLTRGMPLAPALAAQHLQAVATAVHYAHGQGVLHRDLKPSNILIDAFGHPRVTDFGLAQPLGEESELTRTTDALGSPPFMAPEQMQGKAGNVGIAADVYSLGAVLYQLLTGRPPFQGISAAQILSQVERDAPLRPRRLHPAVPVDLETICLKCLEKQPSQRYASAAALAEDLGRFLRGETVQARPLGMAARAWRWARRNPALAGVSLGALFSVLIGSSAVIYQAVENRAQHTENERLADTLHTSLYATDVFAAWQSVTSGDLKGARTWLAPHEHDAARGLEWQWLWRLAQPQFAREIGRHDGYVQRIACSAGGRWLVSTGFDDHVKLWDLTTEPPAQILDEPNFVVTPQFVGPLGQQKLSWVQQSILHECRLPGLERHKIKAPPMGQISFSNDGSLAVVGSSIPIFFSRQKGSTALYETGTWSVKWKVPAESVTVALNADGTQLATASLDGNVSSWDVASQQMLGHFMLPEVCVLKFSPNGNCLAAGGLGQASLMHSGHAELSLPHPTGHAVTDVAFSPDGLQLATSCTDREIRLWQVSDGKLMEVRSGHEREAWTVSFRPNSESMISGGKDGRILEWKLGAASSSFSPMPADAYLAPIFSPDGKEILAANDREGMVETLLLACPSGQVQRKFPGRLPLGFARDGTFMLRNSAANQMEWWSREGTVLRTVQLVDAGTHFYQTVVAPDEKSMVIASDDGRISLQDLREPAAAVRVVMLPTPPVRPLHLRSVRWSPDGRWVAIGMENAPYSAWVLDVVALKLTELPGQLDLVSGVAFSPDSKILATGTSEGSILIYRLPGLELVTKLPGHSRSVADVCFAPDGYTLVSLGYPAEIKCWHTGLWRELATFPQKEIGFLLAISPDGRWLGVNVGKDGKVESIDLQALK